MIHRNWSRILIIFQVFLVSHGTYGCTDGLNACFRYFTPREQVLGTAVGICDLVADQLDCLTMTRLSCSPGGAVPIDGALLNMKSDYEASPTNCVFNSIGQTPDYAVYQCTKLFDDCRTPITDTSCGQINGYEACVDGLSLFCSAANLQNVTNFIESEKLRLNAELACGFVPATTELSGQDCYDRFTSCHEAQGVSQDSEACLAVPVFDTCLKTQIIDVCDAATTGTIATFVSSKQSQCDLSQTDKKTTTTSTSIQQPRTIYSSPATSTSRTSSSEVATPVVQQKTTFSFVSSTSSVSAEGITSSKKSSLTVTDKSINGEVKVTELGPGRLYVDFSDNPGSALRLDSSLFVFCLLVRLISKRDSVML